ncbi:MAG: hypothetical protein ACK5IB_12620 [Qingshengfaniella sp.]
MTKPGGLPLMGKVVAGISWAAAGRAVPDAGGGDTVIVTGVSHVGVRARWSSTRFPTGARVIVAPGCCGDPDPVTHRANLADVGRRSCDVRAVAEVIGHLNGRKTAAE